MRTYTPRRLWADVPVNERIDEAFLQTCGGAAVPRWIDRHLRNLARLDGCAAAVLWYRQSNKWKPCSRRVAPGERFCSLHGGPPPPPPIKPAPVYKPAAERAGRARRAIRRHARAIETFGNAAEAIGPIAADTNLFLLTRGQFSMIDMVRHVLADLGPAAVSLWTWAIADYEVEVLGGLMADRNVTAARLILDRSAEHRNAPIVRHWRERFGDDTVRVCKNHAKIARVWTVDRRVLIRGSMNLNYNPRFEQADLTVNGDDFDLVTAIEDALPILPPLCENSAADDASGLSRAFETGGLAAFAGVKTWAK
jgi:hypothetical protein